MNPVGYLETGVIECADNLESLEAFPSGCVDLIYLDPPFFSNRHQQTVWGREYREFDDKWDGGITEYLDFMHERIRQMYRVLKPTGSLYFHCDWHASHYLKVMLDTIFGIGQFRNEIIWERTAAKGSQMNRLPSNHDVILVYARSGASTWHEITIPYDADQLDEKTAEKYSHRDPDGRRYQLTSLLHPEQGKRPNLDYEVLGVRRTWRWSKDRMEKAIADGRVVQTKPGRVPREKRYLDRQKGRTVDRQKGRTVGDVWTDISPLNSQAAERLGYPTQKPAALLERIIEMSSSPGDIVLDPFCGCGTTIAVAERLHRRWIGIDKSPAAAGVMKRRMDAMGAENVQVHGLPVTMEDLKGLDPFEFQSWIVQRVLGSPSPRKSGDMGIDGLSFFEGLPIQVKQSDKVGRKVVDEFETAIARTKSHKGYLIAFSFARGAIDESARTRMEDGPEVALVKVADVLRIGGLVELAERERADPDRVPDLDGLFKTKQRLAEDFTLIPGPRKATRRKPRKTTPRQLRLDQTEPKPD